MNHPKLIAAMLIPILFTSCLTLEVTEGEIDGTITGYSEAGDAITDIGYDVVTASGFSYGDMVSIASGEYTSSMPLCSSAGDVDAGSPAAVLDEEECPYEAQVNVVITDNEAIREVNLEYRQIDAATDVLSFPMLEYNAPGDLAWLTEEEDYNPDCFDPDTGELLLGDIMISAEKVISQAEEYGHSRERELAFLTAHSMLHLFGYDHMEEEERAVMEEKQRELLNGLGITR